MIYQQNRIVSASYCGSDAKLSSIGALMLIEDAVTEMMGKLQIDGLTVMKKYQAVMVFTRNHIKFIKPIVWQEAVMVECFISAKSLVRFTIDTCIKDKMGKICVYSRVELCALDQQTKRIRKIMTVGVDERIAVEQPQCAIDFYERNTNYELQYCEDVIVRSSNIDYIHHTNNVEYMRFILDAFTVAELEQQSIKELELNYLNQSYEKDVLSIYTGTAEHKIYIVIKKAEQPILKCVMEGNN